MKPTIARRAGVLGSLPAAIALAMSFPCAGAAGAAPALGTPGFGVTAVTVGNDPSPVAFDPVNGTFYVGNLKDGTVSVVRESTRKVVTTFPAGDPEAIAFDPLEKTMDVADYADDEVAVYSASTNKLAATVPFGPAPQQFPSAINNFAPDSIAVDPNTGKVFVSSRGAASDLVYVLGSSFGPWINTITAGPANGDTSGDIAIDPSTDTVYVAITKVYSGTIKLNEVAVINGLTDSVTGDIPLPAPVTAHVAFNPQLHQLYVSMCCTTRQVWVINTRTSQLRKINLPYVPLALAPDPAAADFDVASTGSVFVVDAASGHATGPIFVKSPYALGGIAVDPGTGTIYTADELDRTPSFRTVSVVTEATCTAHQLAASLGRLNAGAGRREITLTVTNHSSAWCKLAGYPGLRLLSRSGHLLAVHVGQAAASHGAVILAGGDAAHACLGWEALFGPFVTPYSVQVALPGVSGHLTFRWTWGRIGMHKLSVTPLLTGGTC
jgi:YVTN family beta-propeller protein